MTALILGSTGYVGMMLMRILASHPHINQIIPVSRSAAGKTVRSEDPGIGSTVLPRLSGTGGCYVDLESVDFSTVDIVFSALPHAAAAPIIGPLVGTTPVIDLSADFRITDPDVYAKVYGVAHPHPELLERAVYGLSEWNRDKIATADIVACPGCYPTATLLPLLPFINRIQMPAVVNACSGISGAGRKESQDLLFNERSENMNAYNPGKVHRHVPEMLQELRLRSAAADILFTPHLVPLKQGMIVTTVGQLTEPLSQEEAQEIITRAYADSVFVGLATSGLPQTRFVRNTNRCDIAVRVHGTHIQVFSALDNLFKGAAGQAVQNMNLRMGFPEDAGLRVHGEF